jgi:photosystem II stability/assembly factor-like uncharacterized protein
MRGEEMRRRLVNIAVSMLIVTSGISCAAAQPEAVYMSILNTRAHQWNRNDYPMIGLFESTDKGATWQHKGWREYIRMFHTVEGNDGTLWSACGNGVLRSLDGGASWKITTGWQVTEVKKMAVDANRPDHVYAATAYGPIGSTDRGETWRFHLDGLDAHFVSEVCVNRSNGDHLLLASETGIFASIDGGLHWGQTGLKGKAIRTIVQDPRETHRFWAGTEDEGIWCSSDGGASWSAANKGLNHKTVYSIIIGSDRERVMFAATHGGGVYCSTDSGSSWHQRIDGLKDLEVHALALTSGEHPVLFAGTMNDGLYRSEDLGATWKFTGQAEAQVWGLSVGGGKGGIRK